MPPYLTQPVLEFQLLAFCFTANKLPGVVEFLKPSLQTIRTVPRPDLQQVSACLVHWLHRLDMGHDVVTQYLEEYQNQMSFYFRWAHGILAAIFHVFLSDVLWVLLLCEQNNGRASNVIVTFILSVCNFFQDLQTFNTFLATKIAPMRVLHHNKGLSVTQRMGVFGPPQTLCLANSISHACRSMLIGLLSSSCSAVRESQVCSSSSVFWNWPKPSKVHSSWCCWQHEGKK